MGGGGSPGAAPTTLCDGGSLCGAATDEYRAFDSRGPAEPASAVTGDRTCDCVGAEIGPRLDSGGGNTVIREDLGRLGTRQDGGCGHVVTEEDCATDFPRFSPFFRGPQCVSSQHVAPC